MQADDRAALDGLFNRLSQVEGQAPTRDAAAEAFIRDRIATQPAAPYYMAQTVVVQEHALNQAQARIQELEAQVMQQQQQPSGGGGGIFGGIFGGGQQPAPAPQAAPGYGAQPASPQAMGAHPGAQQAPSQGGGFLAGAAQTAMGVAGGMLVANAIGGMFDGGEAQAAEAPAEPAPEPEAEAEAEAVEEQSEGGSIFDMFGGGDEEF